MISFRQFLKEQESIPEKVNGKPSKNSEGKLIHFTIDGINNFWKWFGKSKTVDESGRPHVFYHGSDYEDFKPRRNMLWFTVDKKAAETYSDKDYKNFEGSKLYPCYLKLEKIADEETVIKIANKLGIIEEDTVEDYGAPVWELMDWNENLVDELKKNYDAVHILADAAYDEPFHNMESYCVFSLKTVKSALGNKGTFKPGTKITENKHVNI